MMSSVAGVFALAFSIAPARADDALPKAETIIDHYIEVTGGAAAYQKRKTEIRTGTLEFAAQGLKGTLTIYGADPDKVYTVIDLAGIGKIEQGSAGGVAWEKTAMTGARVKTGVEKAQALREGTFNSILHWRNLYSKAETVGVETVNGEECYKVVMTPNEGMPETSYYSKKSGFEMKSEATLNSPQGDVKVEVMSSDYKNFDGVLMPTKVTQRVAGQEIVTTIDSVKVNPDIPADRFALPADVKALLDKGSAPPAPKQ